MSQTYEIDRRLAALVRQKITLQPTENARAVERGPRLGGMPLVLRGEEWPSCEKCAQRLTFLAQSPVPSEVTALFGGAVFFTLYYCLQCRPGVYSQTDFRGLMLRTFDKPEALQLVKSTPSKTICQKPVALVMNPIPSLPALSILDRLPDGPGLLATLRARDGAAISAAYAAAASTHGVIDHETGSWLGGYPFGPQEALACTDAELMLQLDGLDFPMPHDLIFSDSGVLQIWREIAPPHRLQLSSECF